MDDIELINSAELPDCIILDVNDGIYGLMGIIHELPLFPISFNIRVPYSAELLKRYKTKTEGLMRILSLDDIQQGISTTIELPKIIFRCDETNNFYKTVDHRDYKPAVLASNKYKNIIVIRIGWQCMEDPVFIEMDEQE